MLLILLVAVWGQSVRGGWFYTRAQPRSAWIVLVDRGCVEVGMERFAIGMAIPTGWHWAGGKSGADWWWDGSRRPVGWQLRLPMWFIGAPLLLVTLAAWLLDVHARRRIRAGLCPKCHYDLRGLAAGTACPECGRSRT